MKTRIERILKSSVAVLALGASFVFAVSPARAQLAPSSGSLSPTQGPIQVSPIRRVVLQLPDLIVENWSIGWSNGRPAVFVTVKNVGTAPTLGPTIAVVRAIGESYVAVPPLAPGQSSMPLPAEFPNILPTGNVYIEADFTKNSVESNEANNGIWVYIDPARWV